jgi:hypothetical protein
MTAHSSILLVGSVPLANSEAVFRLLAASLGRGAKRYPDGETGERKNWIRWQRRVFESSEHMQLVDPNRLLTGYSDGIARPFYSVRDGVEPGRIRFEQLGFADTAIESYGVFKRLKAQGVIPSDVRFQVSIPTVVALLTGFVVKSDRAKVEPALLEVMAREVAKMADRIPTTELAVQWDVCMEIVGYDGGHDLHYADILTESVASICRQVDYVPADAEVGIHLCYGDPGHKHIVEPKDTGTCVLFSNAICNKAKRPVNWIHLPVPRGRFDGSYFSPLLSLAVSRQTEIYLGLVHASDGVAGTLKRIQAAETFLGAFGVATECGFGRRPPESVPGLLEIHRAVAATV